MKYSQICKTRKFVSVFAQFLQLQAYVQTEWAKSSIDICFIFVWKTFAIFIMQHLTTNMQTPALCFASVIGSQLRFTVLPMFGPFLTFEKLMLTQFTTDVLSAASIAHTLPIHYRRMYEEGRMAAVFNELAISTKKLVNCKKGHRQNLNTPPLYFMARIIHGFSDQPSQIQ